MTKPTLTEEEALELAELEAAEADSEATDALARKRQHLAALRMAKKLSATDGKRGLDFEVIETTCGNFAIRRPIDIEVDTFTEGKEGEERASLRSFLLGLRLEPSETEMKKALTDFPAIGGILASAAMALCGARVEHEGK